MNSAENLNPLNQWSIFSVYLEEWNLTVSTTNDDTSLRNGFNSFYSHRTDVDTEGKDFVLDQKANQVSRWCSGKQEILLVFWKCDAGIIPDQGACVDKFRV